MGEHILVLRVFSFILSDKNVLYFIVILLHIVNFKRCMLLKTKNSMKQNKKNAPRILPPEDKNCLPINIYQYISISIHI